jgi:hypothetical protein
MFGDKPEDIKSSDSARMDIRDRFVAGYGTYLDWRLLRRLVPFRDKHKEEELLTFPTFDKLRENF